MKREDYIQLKSHEIFESLTIVNSEFPEQLSDVIVKTAELMYTMKTLRDKYKEAGALPLYNVNTDYENMMVINEFIEDEFLKFGKPVSIQKSYYEISEKKFKDPEWLLLNGYDEWVDEGLI